MSELNRIILRLVALNEKEELTDSEIREMEVLIRRLEILKDLS